MKKQSLLILMLFLVSIAAIAQNVTIPDTNFKNYLVGNTAINTNSDSEIQVTEATAFTGTINCSNLSISDLTGIAYFTNLTFLRCQNNNLSSLNVSQNTELTKLYFDNNFINTIDITQNIVLEKFQCTNNALSNLDLTQNIMLTHLYCYNNSLSGLNLAQNTALTTLSCYDNMLTSLDVSPNTALTVLSFYNNMLTTIDISQNNVLTELYCYNNVLTSLNAANTNNINFTVFNATNNPDLTCIQVDDVTYSTTNWTNVDGTADFSQNCGVIVLVNSISVQGQGGASTITTNNGTLQMQATVLPTTATDQTYTWSVANGTGSAAIDANGLLSAITNGTVTVAAAANDGSGTIGNTVITLSNQTTVGIDDLAYKNLNVYPNPVTDIVNISISEKVTSIKLVDLTGKTIKTFNPENTQLNISAIAAGFYYLEIANTKKKSVVRLVKK